MKKAVAEYDGLMEQCTAFDSKLFTEAGNAGGREYAELCALALPSGDGCS